MIDRTELGRVVRYVGLFDVRHSSGPEVQAVVVRSSDLMDVGFSSFNSQWVDINPNVFKLIPPSSADCSESHFWSSLFFPGSLRNLNTDLAVHIQCWVVSIPHPACSSGIRPAQSSPLLPFFWSLRSCPVLIDISEKFLKSGEWAFRVMRWCE